MAGALLLGATPLLAEEAPATPAVEAATAVPVPVTACPPCDPALCDPEAYWKKARQWQGSDREDEAKLLLRDLARDYPDTPAGARAHAWLAENGDRNRDGRTEFIIGSTLMGAYFGYTATLGIYDDILDDIAWKTAAWMALGGGLTGLGASALASRWMSISDSQAMLYNFAGTWGWMNGYLLYDLIWPLDGNEVLIAGATGMGVGLVTSLALWPWLDVDEGAAQMATSSGVYALEFATLAAVLLGGDRVFRDNESASILGVLLPANGAVVAATSWGRSCAGPPTTCASSAWAASSATCWAAPSSPRRPRCARARAPGPASSAPASWRGWWPARWSCNPGTIPRRRRATTCPSAPAWCT